MEEFLKVAYVIGKTNASNTSHKHIVVALRSLPPGKIKEPGIIYLKRN
jgi:hypothetical protein